MALRPHDVLTRTDRFINQYLADHVLMDTRPLTVSSWEAPSLDDPAAGGGPLAFASMQERAQFRDVGAGARWGLPWRTTWFRLSGQVPPSWYSTGTDQARIELSVDLGFNAAKPGFQAEGLVRTASGLAVKGLQPRNHHVPIGNDGSGEILFYVEAAANPDVSGGNDFKGPRAFAPTGLGAVSTAGTSTQYQLGAIEIQRINVTISCLVQELSVLAGLAAELAETDPRRAHLLSGIDRALSLLDPNDPASCAQAARTHLEPLLAAAATVSAHRVIATGHAHIDSAWLWPVRESARKVTRTFANVVQLMDEEPDLTFTCSSAQHFAWVKDHDPELYSRVHARVMEGRFVPVGNMWVESDVNMPSGEGLARQFLYGSRFFIEEFEQRSDVGWLPDSFGYSAALPQILRKGGLRWFFTQKMCWNDTNRMPHHTFDWEGLDGSRILTHLPPVNTYSGDMRPTELARSVRNFADHDVAASSLMPFGYGDGGGGPSREMLAAGRIQANLEGSPRLQFGTAQEFFLATESELVQRPVWMGEMYLEFHRGIYTSQARTKRGNRRNEALLVEAEAWWTAASIHHDVEYPHHVFDALWKEVLLLQFHDILPGTSIAWVHREAEATHERVTAHLQKLIIEAVELLAGQGTLQLTANPGPVRQAGAKPFSISVTVPERAVPKPIVLDDGSIRLESGDLMAVVAKDGTIASVYDRNRDREVVLAGHSANVLELHFDAPMRWDAWDLDRSAVTDGTELRECTVEVDGSSVLVRRNVSRSTIDQRISLVPDGTGIQIRTRVDWHERQRLLKLAFPLDLHATEAAFETQFGHVRRPLHSNTPWDSARYEVCAHRWVHIGEPDFGIALVNDGLYGHDVKRTAVDGRAGTVVRQSLLRAPTFPDPDADQGQHEFTSVLALAPTIGDAQAQAAWLNSPVRTLAGRHEVTPLVQLPSDSSALISAVKMAADRSGDLIVRMYESCGRRTATRMQVDAYVTAIQECDLAELDLLDGVPGASARLVDAQTIELTLRPFEVLTLRLVLAV